MNVCNGFFMFTLEWRTGLKSSKSAPCNYVDFLLQDSGFLIATFCTSILQQTVKSKVNELEAKLANQLDPFSREHLSCVTSAWKERTVAVLRYGFALGHHAAVEIIRSSAPEQAVRMALAGWETAKGTGLTD